MLDKYFSNYLYPILIIFAKLFVKFGLKANHITILGLIFSFLSFLLVIDHHYIFGLLVFLIGRSMDGIDGIIANNTSKTDFGGFLDIVCDLISYSIIPLAFILTNSSNAIFGSILLASFFGTSSTFLAIAIFESKRKFVLNSDKSFYHVGGIVGSTQTIVFLSLMFVFPKYFNEIALIFSILCMAGTLERIYHGYKILNWPKEFFNEYKI